MFDVDQNITIAMAKGEISNIHLTNGEMSFRKFSEFCSNCQQGGKQESYFIRGESVLVESYKHHGPGHYRHDLGLDSAAFLVIDADHSRASPKECHEALKELELIHFIYTTHSHKEGDVNFRAVIPCYVESKPYMIPTAVNIVKELNDIGCPIGFTEEMGRWGQAWFLPTRDDPSDGLFEHYESFDGFEYKQADEPFKKDAPGNLEAVYGGQSTLDEMYDRILQQKAGVHDALRDLSFQQIKDGAHPTHVAKNLEALMRGVTKELQDHRWQQRYDEIPRLCEIAVEKVEEEDEPDTLEVMYTPEDAPKEDRLELEWPPGLMGQFARDMYDSALYPNKEMCATAVLGIVAGIAGRRFNISDMGLNIYLTYLMPSAMGKGHISRYAKRVLNHAAEITGGSRQFLYPSSFTGEKALLDIMYEQKCGLSIQTESGFKRTKQHGDQSGLQSQILQLYTSSGQYDTSETSAYSDANNNTKPIQAPCLSIIEESTPDVYLDAMKNGELTGQFNRMFVFRLGPEMELQDGKDVWKMHLNPEYRISAEVDKKLSHLAARCGEFQKQDDPDASHFTVTKEMRYYARDLKQAGLEILESEPHKGSMMQRSGEKAYKVAALVTLFNRHFEKKQRTELTISDEAWDWAKHLHEFEMQGLEYAFRRSDQDGMEELIERNMVRPICKLLQPKSSNEKPYADKRLGVSRVDQGKNRIPMTVLRRALKNCRPINELGNTKFSTTSGFMEMLKYMQANGYAKVSKDKKHFIVQQLLFENFIL